MTELVTLDFVKSMIPGIPATADAFYQMLIKASSDACQQYVGRDLGVMEVTEYHDGRSGQRFVLDRTPVVSVASLVVDGVALGQDDFRVDQMTGVVTMYHHQPLGLDAIVVTYSAGFNPIPMDIQTACTDTIQLMARRVKAIQGGVSSRTIDGGTEQYETVGPTDFAKAILIHYRMGGARC